jgi:hypothetical protein
MDSLYRIQSFGPAYLDCILKNNTDEDYRKCVLKIHFNMNIYISFIKDKEWMFKMSKCFNRYLDLKKDENTIEMIEEELVTSQKLLCE